MIPRIAARSSAAFLTAAPDGPSRTSRGAIFSSCFCLGILLSGSTHLARGIRITRRSLSPAARSDCRRSHTFLIMNIGTTGAIMKGMSSSSLTPAINPPIPRNAMAAVAQK